MLYRKITAAHYKKRKIHATILYKKKKAVIMNVKHRVTQIVEKSRSHLKILAIRWVI